MKEDMPKTYDHASVEQTWYEKWEKSGYFHAALVARRGVFRRIFRVSNGQSCR